MNEPSIAVLGLGAMGSRLALRLLQRGYHVRCFNRSPVDDAALREAGATFAATPRSAVAGVAFALAMVRDDAAAEAIWLDEERGALKGLDANAVAMDCSTLSVAMARRLADHAGVQGFAFLDAPVVGSRPQADAGQLVVLVGGKQAALERATPVLSAFAGAVHHVGKNGDGAALKLAINTLFATQVAALAELLGSLSRSGVDATRAVDVLGATAVCSPAAKAAAASMLSSSFAPLFPVALVAKDLGYAVDAAEAAGADLPIGHAVRDVFHRAAANGFGADHLTVVAQLYRAP